VERRGPAVCSSLRPREARVNDKSTHSFARPAKENIRQGEGRHVLRFRPGNFRASAGGGGVGRVVGHPAAARQLSGSASFSESHSGKIGHISFGVKQTRKPSAGNLHAGFDEAGTGNQLTVWLVRHSQRKRRATARPNLRSMAPVLDPTTCQAWLIHSLSHRIRVDRYRIAWQTTY
jgi:hypothetical protein